MKMKSIELEVEKRLTERFDVELANFLKLEKEDSGLEIILSSTLILLLQFISSFFLLRFIMNGEEQYSSSLIVYNVLFIFLIIFDFFLTKHLMFKKKKNINNIQLNMKNIKEFKESRFSKINNGKCIVGLAQLGFVAAMIFMLVDAKHIVKYHPLLDLLIIFVCLLSNAFCSIILVSIVEYKDKASEELNKLVNFQKVETPKIIKEIIAENNLDINSISLKVENAYNKERNKRENFSIEDKLDFLIQENFSKKLHNE